MLLLKHPTPPLDSVIPPPPPAMAIEVEESDIARAIKSFPCGSAGGPDRMHPQHLNRVSYRGWLALGSPPPPEFWELNTNVNE